MRRTGLVFLVLVLLATATIANAAAQPMLLPVTMSATTTLVLQQDRSSYAGTTDVYFDRLRPDQNWGDGDRLMITACEGRAALVRFELAAYVPPGSTVTAAILEVYAADRNRPLSERISAYRVLEEWVEGEANWNRAAVGSPWGSPGCSAPTDRELTPADTVTAAQVGQWYRFNITGMVQDWVNSPANNHGVLLKGVNECLPIEYMFCASESRMASNRPILRIVYAAPTPTPTASATATSSPTPSPTATATITPTPTPSPTAPPASVAVEPANSVVARGESFTIGVIARGVTDLGGFEYTLRFDPSVVRVEAVALEGFLGSTGRTVATIGPDIDHDTGSVHFGGFSYGSAAGPAGAGMLASMSLRAIAAGNSALAFEQVQLTDTHSATMGIAAATAGAVTVLPVTETATPTATLTPTPTASPTLIRHWLLLPVIVRSAQLR